ncbi:ER-golgi trafficking TRAPP I complex 85 kDa subunit-domain-containing protein [Haematococcus lacustris]
MAIQQSWVVVVKKVKVVVLVKKVKVVVLVHCRYRLAAQDYLAASNSRWYAGVEEMLGLCVLMSPDDNDPQKYFQRAYEHYAKLPGKPARMLASRAALISATYLQAAARFLPASVILMRAHFEEENARAALLLEQSAYCLLYPLLPSQRKFAFQMVLAGLRYHAAGQKRLAIQAYRQVLGSYQGRRWRAIEEHLNDILGKQSRESGEDGQAALHFLALLQDCSAGRPAATQAHYLSQFLEAARKVAAKEVPPGTPFAVPGLQLPLVNGQEASVVFSDSGCAGNAAAHQVPPGVWLQLEACCCGDTGNGSSNWLDAAAAPVKQETAEHEEFNAVVVGEPVSVRVQFRNPLAVKLRVSAVRLMCEFTPQAGLPAPAEMPHPVTGGAEQQAAGPLPGLPVDPHDPHPLAAGAKSLATANRHNHPLLEVADVSLTLHPGEVLSEMLSVTPRVPGTLRISGVTWLLADCLEGSVAFNLRGRHRKHPKGSRRGGQGGDGREGGGGGPCERAGRGGAGRGGAGRGGAGRGGAGRGGAGRGGAGRGGAGHQEERGRVPGAWRCRPAQQKHFAPHRRLVFSVVGALPRLELAADSMPGVMYAGEVSRVVLVIRNTGSLPCRNLQLVASGPELCCPAAPTGQDLPLVRAVADMSHVIAPERLPASCQGSGAAAYRPCPRSTVLGPGQEVQCPLWLHPTQPGSLNLQLLWYCEPLTCPPGSLIRFRTLRLAYCLHVAPLLLVRPSAQPCPGDVSAHLLRLDLELVKDGEATSIEQVTALSQGRDAGWRLLTAQAHASLAPDAPLPPHTQQQQQQQRGADSTRPSQECGHTLLPRSQLLPGQSLSSMLVLRPPTHTPGLAACPPPPPSSPPALLPLMQPGLSGPLAHWYGPRPPPQPPTSRRTSNHHPPSNQGPPAPAPPLPLAPRPPAQEVAGGQAPQRPDPPTLHADPALDLLLVWRTLSPDPSSQEPRLGLLLLRDLTATAQPPPQPIRLALRVAGSQGQRGGPGGVGGGGGSAVVVHDFRHAPMALVQLSLAVRNCSAGVAAVQVEVSRAGRGGAGRAGRGGAGRGGAGRGGAGRGGRGGAGRGGAGRGGAGRGGAGRGGAGRGGAGRGGAGRGGAGRGGAAGGAGRGGAGRGGAGRGGAGRGGAGRGGAGRGGAGRGGAGRGGAGRGGAGRGGAGRGGAGRGGAGRGGAGRGGAGRGGAGRGGAGRGGAGRGGAGRGGAGRGGAGRGGAGRGGAGRGGAGRGGAGRGGAGRGGAGRGGAGRGGAGRGGAGRGGAGRGGAGRGGAGRGGAGRGGAGRGGAGRGGAGRGGAGRGGAGRGGAGRGGAGRGGAGRGGAGRGGAGRGGAGRGGAGRGGAGRGGAGRGGAGRGGAGRGGAGRGGAGRGGAGRGGAGRGGAGRGGAGRGGAGRGGAGRGGAGRGGAGSHAGQAWDAGGPSHAWGLTAPGAGARPALEAPAPGPLGGAQQQQQQQQQGVGGGQGFRGPLVPAGLEPSTDYMWCGRTFAHIHRMPPGCTEEVPLQLAVFWPGTYAVAGCYVHYTIDSAHMSMSESQRVEKLLLRVEAA